MSTPTPTLWLCLASTCFSFLVPESALAAERPLLPPPAPSRVDFIRDIKPIFEASCAQCHARGKHKGDFSMETRELFLEGGDSGVPAVAGRSDESLMVAMIAGLDPENIMPQKGKRLTTEQVGLIRAWIDQDMPWPEEVSLAKTEPANLRARAIADFLLSPQFANPIDGLVDDYFRTHGLVWPALVDDRTYARRVWLDTIGLLPPPAELAAFLADGTPDKRARLVERLLADDRAYADHWLTFWNDLLRNDYKAPGGRKQITEWLYPALTANLPYTRFVSELIDPHAESEGFTKGIVWRGTVNASMQPPIQAAQNIAQVFLGVNLKCASCHDSFINEYTLADAYGLGAVYADAPLEIAECDKPTGRFGQVKFLYESLGTIDAGAGPAERKRQLAAIMTGPANGRLPRTIVNRFWQRFMGRGLVEPVDEMDQTAWSPVLMDWLAEDFAAQGSDLRRLIARILTSRAYQLPAVDLGESRAEFVFRGPGVRRLSAEQFIDAVLAVSGAEYPAEAARVNRPVALAAPAAAELPLMPQWIWSEPGAAGRTAAGKVAFSREIELPEPPSEAFITLSADNSYDLRVNGVEIGRKSTPNGNTETGQYDVRAHLKPGRNVIAVLAANEALDPITNTVAALEAKDETRSLDTAAGLLLYARIRAGNQVRDVVSDASWTAQPEGQTARTAVPLGGITLKGWNAGPRFLRVAASTPEKAGVRRASLMLADPLQVALGRPNREQVVTVRPDQATTLQALELANGGTFDALLGRAAQQIAQDAKTGREGLITQLYLRALGRNPTPDERNTAGELLGLTAGPEGIQDLLWVMCMLPEFQLIR